MSNINNPQSTKIIFVDFDDTLCLHTTKIISSHYVINKCLYKESKPNKDLIKLLFLEKSAGASVILLSMSSSYILKYKKEWCEYTMLIS